MLLGWILLAFRSIFSVQIPQIVCNVDPDDDDKDASAKSSIIKLPFWRALTIVIRFPIPLQTSSGRIFRPTLILSFKSYWTFFSVQLEAFPPEDGCGILDQSNEIWTGGNQRTNFDYDLSFLDHLHDSQTAVSTEPFLLPGDETERQPRPELSVIIGNQPLPPFTHDVLQMAAGSVVCADGGANRLVEFYRQTGRAQGAGSEDTERGKERWGCGWRVPTAVVGDLDSLNPEVQQLFESLGVPIIRNSEQDTNDLEKSWEYLVDNYESKREKNISAKRTIVLLGVLGGRFDQSISNIHLLYKLTRPPFQPSLPMVVVVDYSSVCLVCPRGCSTVALPDHFVSSSCGLLPLVSCRSISTFGLKWDLRHCPLAVDDIVSSSNKVLSHNRKVIIQTSDPVLWHSEIVVSSGTRSN